MYNREYGTASFIGASITRDVIASYRLHGFRREDDGDVPIGETVNVSRHRNGYLSSWRVAARIG
jgi:hypothetical protein